MVIAGHLPCPAARWVLAVLLLVGLPGTAAGEPLAGPSRGEDNRTERGNEALTGGGAWTSTLAPPDAATTAQPRTSARAKPASAEKKPRVRVKRTANARRVRPETTSMPMNLDGIRRAVFTAIREF